MLGHLRIIRGLEVVGVSVFLKWLDFSFQLPALVIDLCDLTFLEMQKFIYSSISFQKDASEKEYHCEDMGSLSFSTIKMEIV
jgi:hypothetical protein